MEKQNKNRKHTFFYMHIYVDLECTSYVYHSQLKSTLTNN